jgi:excisionase family DNA binding protein
MKHQRQRLKQALDNLRHALEETESVLLESDGTFFEEEEKQQVRQTQERRGEDLLSVMEVCQELGMGQSWVYKRIQSGEIPSIKLGRNVKVKREDLHQYLESQQRQALVSEKPFSRNSVV